MTSKKLFIIICLSFITIAFAVTAASGNEKKSNEGEEIAVAIASDHIDVNMGFNGSSIELFGDRRDKDAIVAVVVKGPEKDITIWKKSKIMGAWINRYYAKFEKMPVYYHYAISTDNIDQKLHDLMIKNAIGHDAIFNMVKSNSNRPQEDIKVFQEALLKKNYEKGVFFEKPAKINFINDNFFHVSFYVSPSAVTGEYEIHSFLIKNYYIAEHEVKKLKVEQVGLNAFIYQSAHEYSLVYAFICIALAVFSGWIVSSLRVRP